MENVAERGLEYPAAWKFDEDGSLVAGTFVKFDKGETKEYGSRVILVLDVDGTERAVWLSQLALFSRVRDELNRRPSKTLEPGERVVIKRLEKKMGENGREYWPFQVLFPDRPELSTTDLFNLDEGHVSYEQGNLDQHGDAVTLSDGDIPY
jgi:hypothetical protein